MMQIHFTKSAIVSFNEEVDFIHKKWNLTEVENFFTLIDNFKNLISINPYLGKKSNKKDIRLFVLSKQTIIFYKVVKEKNRIDLLLFWNTKRNPNYISKSKK